MSKQPSSSGLSFSTMSINDSTPTTPTLFLPQPHQFIDNPAKPPYTFSHRVIEEHKTGLYDVRFCPFVAEDIFAVCSNAQVTVYECLEDGKRISSCAAFQSEDENENFYCLNWVSYKKGNQTNIYLVVGNNHGLIRVLDSFEDREVRKLYTHTGAVNQLVLHPQFKSIFASASQDFSIRIWHCNCTIPLVHLNGHDGEVLSVSFHQSGKYLVSGSMDHSIRVWDIEQKESKTIASKLDFSKRSFGYNKETVEIHVWAAKTKEIHTNYVDCVEFLGNYIISRSSESVISIWKFGDFNDPSPCGKGSQDEFDTPTVTSLLAELSIKDAYNWFIRFGITRGDKDGESWIAVGNDARYIFLWDLRARPIPMLCNYKIFDFKLPLHIRKISFNRNGKIMIAVGSDGNVSRCDKVPGYTRERVV